MEELYVKPGYWFEAEINGKNYKCKIKKWGYTFATIHVKHKIGFKRMKKYFLFGPMIDMPVFETVTRSHRSDGVDPVMEFQSFYKAKGIKMIIEKIIEQKPPRKHSYKI